MAMTAYTDADVERVIADAVREVAELPDRTSPADAPDMMLVTADELSGILRAALAAMPDGRDAALADMEFRKDAAYLERNQIVAALASVFPAGIARTDIPGWLPEWHGCVYIDLPTGQASWHYHDSHAHLFAHLPPYAKAWDGHTTEQKYQRLAALSDIGIPISGTMTEPDERDAALVAACLTITKAMDVLEGDPSGDERYQAECDTQSAIAAMRAALKAQPASGGWNFDMSAAPRNKAILLGWIGDDHMEIGGWASAFNTWSGSESGYWREKDQPTAWCHLPAPPSQEGSGE